MKYIHSDKLINDRSFSLDKFLSPSAQFFPAFAWAWGSPVNKDSIKKQIDDFYSGGIRKLYIIPEPASFRPSYSMEPDYLTEDFFKLFKFAYEYAAEKGMALWLYDEGGWPSGSACGKVLEEKPHLESKRLSVRTVSSPYIPGEGAVAAFSDGKRIYEGDFSDKPITEYFMQFRGLKYPNISDGEATDTFIRITHEEYKKHIGHMFGKSVTAMFTDEPVAERTGFSESFPEKFKARYGYDILDHLPVIFKDADEEVSEEEKKIRIDYLDLLGDEFAENFFIKCRTWCHENNLLFTGHLDDEDETYNKKQRFYNVLRQMRAFDMPGIDVIWRQIFPGKENHFFPRFAASAAHQTGNPYTISESFAVYGSGLTFKEMRYILLYQIIRGINTFNFNSISFCYDGLDRKNARPGFMPSLPTWKHLKLFNTYTARLSYLASLGLPASSCAVYMPHQSFWAGGSEAQKAADTVDLFVKKLERKHAAFDLIDDDFLETATLKGNTLCTGTASYSVIFMQKDARIPLSSKEKLALFKKAGGKVYFEEDIEKAPGAAKITGKNISLFKKNLGSGFLYILQNESTNEETFSIEFSESGNVYEISACDGKIYEPILKDITLCGGEERIFLITDAILPASERSGKKEKSIVIDKFMVKRNSSFVIGEETLEKHIFDEEFFPTVPGDWCNLFGENFSGEAAYKIEFDFENIPESIEIDLGEVNYSCDVTLNGYDSGTVFAPPYVIRATKDILKKHNTLIVNVSNTHANQYVFSKAFDNISEDAIGPYHSIAKQFESESLKSGLLTAVTIRF